MSGYIMFYSNAMPYERDPCCGVREYGLTLDEVLQRAWDGKFKDELQSKYNSLSELRGSLVKGSWDLPGGGISIRITGSPTMWYLRNKDGKLVGGGRTPQEAVYSVRGSYRLTEKPKDVFAHFVNEYLKDKTPMEIAKFVEESEKNRQSPRHLDIQVVFECATGIGNNMVKSGCESMQIGEYTFERVKLTPETLPKCVDGNIWEEPFE